MTAKKEFGNLSVASTGSDNPMLAGNLVALLSPIIFVPILTYSFGPQNYDYKSMAAIRLDNDEDITASTDVEQIPSGVPGMSTAALALEQKKLKRASLIAKSMSALMTLAIIIVWPMPMYTPYIFSKKFFTGWVSVSISWLFCSACAIGLYPLWEGRHSMADTFRGIARDLSRKGKPTIRGRVIEGNDEPTSPLEESKMMPIVVTEKEE